jgi:hypothetical protein
MHDILINFITGAVVGGLGMLLFPKGIQSGRWWIFTTCVLVLLELTISRLK